MNKKLFISFAITFVYAVFTLIAVLHHEIWADEAQVWQLCRYLSVPELITHLHNEGHPSLFYLLLMPFAKTLPNILCMQIVCWFFMCISVFLLFYYAPFKIITKTAIVLSAGFIYFLPVIARSYSLLPCLVFMAAILYSKQKQHPVLYCITIAIIANIHAIMFAFATVLTGYFIYDNIIKNLKEKKITDIKQYAFSAFIAILGLILCILQLHDTTSSNSCITFSLDDIPRKTAKVLLFFFINAYNNMITVRQSLYIPVIDITSIAALIIIFILMFRNLYQKSKRLFAIALISIGFQLGIYIFTYSAHTYVTRIFSGLIILIFCFWILQTKNTEVKNNNAINILLAIFFFLTSYNGINYYIQEIKYNYAGAKEAAEYIKNNIDSNSAIFLITNEPYFISLVYYLGDDYKLYSVIREKPLEYVIWDKTAKLTIYDSNWKNAIEYYYSLKYGKDKDYYVINSFSGERYGGINNKQLKLIFKNKKTIEPVEGYSIYKYIEE